MYMNKPNEGNNKITVQGLDQLVRLSKLVHLNSGESKII